MYNPTTSVQIPTDADLGCYYFKKIKIIVGTSRIASLSKKNFSIQGGSSDLGN
jgi:hypothetical protein